MNTHFSLASSFYIATWLLWCDVRLFLKDWKNNVINNPVWPLVIISVNAYVMPAMGMPTNYGSFFCMSMLIIMASFMAWTTGNILVADLEGPRAISYDLTLPLPYWMVYIKNVFSVGLKAALYSICSLVVGKVVLWSSFDLSHASAIKFLLIYLIATLFFGAFTVWASVFAGTTERYSNIELRFSGPLFFVCGFTAPWVILHSIALTISHIMLASPWIYAYEGTRAALLGQGTYLNYYVCVAMLNMFMVLFTLHDIYLFKKRLDCV